MAIRSASFAVLVNASAAAQAASPYEDVQRIGLPPLYEALVAVANCLDVTIDAPRFRSVAAQYHLRPEDLTLSGPNWP